MVRVNIGGLIGGVDITGTGGGLGSGVGQSNHGLFMHKLIGDFSGVTLFDGTAGFGDRSEDEDGKYFLRP